MSLWQFRMEAQAMPNILFWAPPILDGEIAAYLHKKCAFCLLHAHTLRFSAGTFLSPSCKFPLHSSGIPLYG
jgi:hypothetical protein